MLEIGLTGGIGSGKSTVALLLVQQGAELVDADALVHELQAPGAPVFLAMVERWGPRIVGGDGTLDRGAVADIVFSDSDELKALNGIVHPAVSAEMTRRREALAATDATVILEIPLLVESGHEGLHGVVVVDVDPEVAVERLMAGRGFEEQNARDRIGSQASRGERLALADVVIDNNGSLSDLSDEVDRCWTWIESLPRPPLDREIRPIGGRAGRG